MKTVVEIGLLLLACAIIAFGALGCGLLPERQAERDALLAKVAEATAKIKKAEVKLVAEKEPEKADALLTVIRDLRQEVVATNARLDAMDNEDRNAEGVSRDVLRDIPGIGGWLAAIVGTGGMVLRNRTNQQRAALKLADERKTAIDLVKSIEPIIADATHEDRKRLSIIQSDAVKALVDLGQGKASAA